MHPSKVIFGLAARAFTTAKEWTEIGKVYCDLDRTLYSRFSRLLYIPEAFFKGEEPSLLKEYAQAFREREKLQAEIAECKARIETWKKEQPDLTPDDFLWKYYQKQVDLLQDAEHRYETGDHAKVLFRYETAFYHWLSWYENQYNNLWSFAKDAARWVNQEHRAFSSLDFCRHFFKNVTATEVINSLEFLQERYPDLDIYKKILPVSTFVIVSESNTLVMPGQGVASFYAPASVWDCLAVASLVCGVQVRNKEEILGLVPRIGDSVIGFNKSVEKIKEEEIEPTIRRLRRQCKPVQVRDWYNDMEALEAIANPQGFAEYYRRT